MMTEQPSNSASNNSEDRATLEAQLDDQEQLYGNLSRAMRLQFASAWQNDAAVSDLPVEASLNSDPGGVMLYPNEANTAASGAVSFAVHLDNRPSWLLTLRNPEDLTDLGVVGAADRLGVDANVVHQATDRAVELVQADIAQHRSLDQLRESMQELEHDLARIDRGGIGPEADQEVRMSPEEEREMREQHEADMARDAVAGLDPAEAKELADQISWSSSNANELEAELDDVSAAENSESGPEWATDSVDQPFTPERVTADWVQSTTMVETYLETDRLDLARQWIDELDENLQAFEDGEVPPGSDELYSVYHDAVARAAIPYGQAPISVDEVQRQLGNVGINVPHFDLDHIREATGIMPLGRDHVTAKLDQEAAPPTGLEDVAAARLSVRRAMASITEDSESAQTHLQSANTALTEAVDTMRPEQTHANVTAAQESVKQASERVDAVAETAKNVETEATLYTVPDCPGCFATKRAMDKAGVEYEEIDLSTNPELLQQFKRQSLAQAPIVETQDGDRWSGYNPTKLREHGLDYRSRQQRGNDSGRDTGHGR